MHPNSHSGMYLEARVWAMSSHAAAPDALYVGSDMGVFRWSEAAARWTRCDHGLISADVHGLAVAPRPDGSTALFATTNMGLHVSTDEGATWTFRKLDSPWQYTRAIVPRADLRGVLFLTNGNGPPGTTGRLLVSSDHGDTWDERALPGALNSTPWCVATHAAKPMLVFVCTNLGQVFRSTDGGDSFERLPHEFGELRALHWTPLPPGARRQGHSVTLRAAA